MWASESYGLAASDPEGLGVVLYAFRQSARRSDGCGECDRNPRRWDCAAPPYARCFSMKDLDQETEVWAGPGNCRSTGHSGSLFTYRMTMRN